MSEIKRIAVLLAAYQGEKYIEAQLNSIVGQDIEYITIFINIDKSKDKTVEICKKLSSELGAKNRNKTIIINDNDVVFGSAGKNFYNIFMTTNFQNFDYVALSDQDDIWGVNKLSRAIDVINRENADAYSSDVIAFWPDGSKEIIKKSQKQKKFDFIFESAGPGCTFVMTRKFAENFQNTVIKKNGSLPFHHDWFIYAYARVKKFKWIIDNEPNLFYRQHADNQVGANKGFRQIISRVNNLKNGDYKTQIFEIINSTNYNINYKKEILINPFQCRRKFNEALFLWCVCMIGWI